MNMSSNESLMEKSLKARILELESANKNLIKKNESLTQDLRKLLDYLDVQSKSQHRLRVMLRDLQALATK